MKAIEYLKYGPPEVLNLKEIKQPTPKNDEVLIKVYATTVTAGDCEVRSFKIPLMFWLPIRIYMGLFKPRIKILGQEFAGEIEEAGKDVKQFKKGDRVFGATEMKLGAYSEYICLPESYPIASIPSNLSYEEAAAVPVGGLNALHFLRQANIREGQKVLINGAAGSIGTFAVQIAKSSGAEVTAVDSTTKLNILLSLGADHVVDYTKEDFTGSGKKYDVIFDVAGKASFTRCIKSLNKNGYYLLANPRFIKMVRGFLISLIGSKKVISGMAPEKNEDLVYLAELVGNGKLKTFIDRRYPLEQIPDAHRYVETGQKKGNVVITVGNDNGK